MARFEIDVSHVRSGLAAMIMDESGDNPVLDFLKEKKLTFFVDESFDFYSHHFDGNNWVTYPNGRVKAGTLRFRDGLVRIPADRDMRVNETFPHSKKKIYRAQVRVPKLVICNLHELTEEELMNDGFSLSIAQVVKSMKGYPGYGSINRNSVVVYYYFGKTEWSK